MSDDNHRFRCTRSLKCQGIHFCEPIIMQKLVKERIAKLRDATAEITESNRPCIRAATSNPAQQEITHVAF